MSEAPSDIAEPRSGDADKVPPYSWYALGVLVIVYVLNFIDRQIQVNRQHVTAMDHNLPDPHIRKIKNRTQHRPPFPDLITRAVVKIDCPA